MIIQLDSATAESTGAARRGLDELARSWDCEITEAPLGRRRRPGPAADLIDHARQLATRQVTIYLISPGRTTDLSTLTPDELLDLADQDPDS